jgi:hypothetical protein
MNRATKQCWIGRFAWAVVAVVAIALVLILSVASTLSVHSFAQTVLALPVFFLFLFLPAAIGDWLDIEDSFFTPEPRFSSSLSRGPPTA